MSFAHSRSVLARASHAIDSGAMGCLHWMRVWDCELLYATVSNRKIGWDAVVVKVSLGEDKTLNFPVINLDLVKWNGDSKTVTSKTSNLEFGECWRRT